MRYLFLNQFFWPDSAPTGQLLGHVAAELVRRGHRVTVIAADEAYAVAGTDQPEGVEIVRVPVSGFSRGRAGRMLSWISFLGGAAVRAVVLPRQDVVVSLTTPPGLSVPAVLLAKAWRGSVWIWEMDLYPDVATSIGEARPEALWVRAISALLLWSRRRATGIIALGECMRRRLTAHGIDASRIVVGENWADDGALPCIPMPPAGPLRILYSGNLGLAHDVETMAGALRILGRDQRFQFRFAGGGAAREGFERRCTEAGLSNVRFEPYCAPENLAQSIGSADISLVTLRPECTGAVVPSKVYSSLAVGRPVLFIGPRDCTTGETIRRNGCGWVVAPGDTGVLVDLLRRLAADRSQVEQAALRARHLFESRYTREHGAGRIADILEQRLPVPAEMSCAQSSASARVA
jgi:glycosyltransferase involved in cell wall biosynthesis